MKVTCDRDVLVHWLQAASAVTTQRSPKPVLACVRMDASADGLSLLATDLEVGLRVAVGKVEVQDVGASLVPADRFHQILRELDSDTVVLTASEREAEVTAPGARFKILGDDPADFPNVPDFPDAGAFEIAADDLLGMIKRTLFATAKEHTRYALNGVLWEAEGTSLTLVATDGHRLSLVKGKCNRTGEEKQSAIVPAKAVALLERCLSMVPEPTAPIQVALGERDILVRSPTTDNGDWTAYSRLVDGHFPKYEDLIPKDYPRKVSLPTEAFHAAVRRAAILTNEESRSVRLQLGEKELVLRSSTPEMGEAEVRMNTDYQDEPIELVYNPAYLIEALKTMDSEEFQLAFKSPSKPGLLIEGRLFKYVVMPVSTV